MANDTGPGARPPERLNALDAVRGFALIVVIGYHAGATFLPTPRQVWLVQDIHTSQVMGIALYQINCIAMLMFFMLAAYFGRISLLRRGVKTFILERLKRLGLPLVVGWPIVITLATTLMVLAYMATHGGATPKPYTGPPIHYPGLPAFPMTHLWFLWQMLQFSAAILLLHAGVAMVDRREAWRARLDRLVSVLVRSGLTPLVLAVPEALALALKPDWIIWVGMPVPVNSLIIGPPALAAFGAAFLFGWALSRQPDLMANFQRRWVSNLIIGLVFNQVPLFIAGPKLSLAVVAPGAPHIIAAIGYALGGWFIMFGVLGAALRFLAGDSPVRRYIADASYWFYIIHLPLVLGMQQLVRDLDWPWFVKFVVIVGVVAPLCFGSYALFVRHTFIGWVLNGPRPRGNRASATLPPVSGATEPAE